MMKALIKILFSILAVFLLFFACSKPEPDDNIETESEAKTKAVAIADSILTIWCYDSLAAENGFAKKATELFTKKHSIKTRIESKGNIQELVNDVIYLGGDAPPDIILGADNIHYQQLKNSDVLLPYKPKNASDISRKFRFDRKYTLTSFDYGYYAFVYDTYAVKNPPSSFGTMQDGRWKKRFILTNPEQNPLGKGMLLYSVAACGTSGYRNFWRAFKENILISATSTEKATKLFFKTKGTFLLSYSTLPAYLNHAGFGNRYKAFIPQEGAFMHLEGAGILRKSSNVVKAKKFIDFLITEECQNLIPTTQWMYPVLKKVELPKSFKALPKPFKRVNSNLSKKDMYELQQLWQETWKKVMERRQTLP